MKRKAKKEKPEPVNHIMRTYLYVEGTFHGRWITVYKDHTISIGGQVRFDALTPKTLQVVK